MRNEVLLREAYGGGLNGGIYWRRRNKADGAVFDMLSLVALRKMTSTQLY